MIGVSMGRTDGHPRPLDRCREVFARGGGLRIELGLKGSIDHVYCFLQSSEKGRMSKVKVRIPLKGKRALAGYNRWETYELEQLGRSLSSILSSTNGHRILAAYTTSTVIPEARTRQKRDELPTGPSVRTTPSCPLPSL